MLSSTSRALLRHPASRQLLRHTAPRRCLTFAPPRSYKPKSWKSSLARWGLAAGGFYWYMTSPIFERDPDEDELHILDTASESETLPTLESLIASRHRQRAALSSPSSPDSSTPPPPPPPSTRTVSQQSAHQSSSAASQDSTLTSSAFPGETASGSPAELEDEAEGEGAFNPETGEINWDCPCLGGMAHGPCGAQFREAFSCFVYSTAEPKGMDCIDRFKTMQDCFREHPDVYGAELADDEPPPDDSDELAPPPPDSGIDTDATPPPPPEVASSTAAASSSNATSSAGQAPSSTGKASTKRTTGADKVSRPKEASPASQNVKDKVNASRDQVATQHGHDEITREGDSIIPKAAFDATDKNEGK